MQLLIDESKQSSLTLFYWKVLKRTLAEIQQPVIDLADNIPPEDLKKRVPHLMDEKKLRKVIDQIWITVGSRFAVSTAKQLEKIPKKADPNGQIDYWEDHFRLYSNERSQAITKQIIDTQTQIVNNIIDRNMREAEQGGLGIPETQRYLRTDLQDTLTEMNKYQAERIARTEVIGASNKGSFDSASKSGLEMKKIWLTSGLDGIRESHIRYGAEDEQSGGRAMDEEYTSGLQYPSDPNADPEEIINCRCTVVYDVDEGLIQQPEPGPAPEPEPEPVPAPEIPKIPEAVPLPEPLPPPPVISAGELGEFVEATSIKEAEEYALKNLGIKYVDYKGLPVEIANNFNKAVRDTKVLMPEIKTNGLGNAQRANKAMKAELLSEYKKSKRYLDNVQMFGQDTADKHALKWVNRYIPKVGKGTWAWSTNTSDVLMPDAAGAYKRYDVSKYKGIFVNENIVKDMNWMNLELKATEESGWWIKGSGTFRDIVQHELGHEIDKTIGFNKTEAFLNIFKREHSKGISYVTERLSKYGATAGGKASHKPMEMIAEAWAEFTTSAAPRPLATEIGEALLSDYYKVHIQGSGIRYEAWRSELMKLIGR